LSAFRGSEGAFLFRFPSAAVGVSAVFPLLLCLLLLLLLLLLRLLSAEAGGQPVLR
jgi:hypothetical protein